MKKLFVLLLICLSSSVLFAQTIQAHYSPVTTGSDLAGQNLSLTGYLAIDHVYQDNEYLEIGVFDQDDICRATKVAKWYPKGQKYIFQLVIKGNEGFTYYCKVYDHESEQELPLELDIDIVLTWSAGGKIGSLGELYEINFTNPNAGSYYTKDIVGYGGGNGKNGYYLLASPIMIDVNNEEGIAPLNVTNLENPDETMVSDDIAYDLFGFDQGAELEWLNYKQNQFRLMPGKGYLYAHETDITLKFEGTPYDGEGIFELEYKEEAQDFKGWNLVGNPFTDNAYIIDHDFYVLEEGMEEVTPYTAGGRILQKMEGAFVVAEGPGESVQFMLENAGKSPVLNLNVTNGRNLVDRAVVRFSEGRNLPKFQLNPNSTKLYIPMDNKDYAVVRSEGVGEMPVSFKAQNNGVYSISFTNEDVNFSYLHLIDNLTGNDVNLLETQSYSFEAKTTDYANRFRLVFATGNASADNFAFFFNNELIISNEGNAMMNVYDITGRLINTQNINGSCQVNLNATPGVYMIQLVNGNNTKTQKIVVK